MKRVYQWSLRVSIVFLLFSCQEKDQVNPLDRVGFSYFPLSIGDYRIFEVETITTTPVQDSLKSNFFIREEVVDSFLATDGDSTYVINRSKRFSESEPWELDSVWSARRTFNQAIKVENNIPFVKLSFPIKQGLSWDGNVLNPKDEELYEVETLREEYQGINETFADVVSIVQADGADTVIFFDYREEKFARGIGLAYKEISQIIYCSDSETGCLGQGIIENSFSYKAKIVEYGIR